MSEQAKEGPSKKKGSKLPIIIALVVLLAGGGYFGMKSKSGPNKVNVRAGATTKLGEFLVNLSSGPNTYLRTEISVQLREGFSAEEFDKASDAVKDAVGTILSSKKVSEVAASARPELKRELAAAINKILISDMKPEEQKKQDELLHNAEPKQEDKGKSSAASTVPVHQDWVDPVGPVLNIYFTAFTTQ